MNEIITMILSIAAGAGLGVLFFGGLWYTVRKAVTAKIPALWVFVSFIIRISATFIGFYFIGRQDWRYLLLCLFGFLLARYGVTRYTKSYDAKNLSINKEVAYGS